MIMDAIKLSKLGRDYWDDADRWTRNQFAENQLTWIGWVDDGHLKALKPRAERKDHRVTDEWPHRTSHRVAERAKGGFAGWGAVNDWNSYKIPLSIQGCCTGSGARALYIIWKNMLDYDEGKLRLHLLFNRASKWADIDSHIPFQGRVDIKAKQDLDLEVRIPGWAKLEDVTAQVDGNDVEVTLDGQYANLGAIKKGQKASVMFPITERTETITVHDEDYNLVIRGNTVVSIDPPGKYCPTYLRAHYRTGETLWTKVERFIPDNELAW